MSLESSLKNHLFKKLDFESCGFKMASTGRRRRRKRLIARLTKGVGIVDKTPERKRRKASRDGESASGSDSPVLTLEKTRLGSLPVLSKRYPGNSGSPVFRCRRDSSPKVAYRSKRKIDFGENKVHGSGNEVTVSPVFKLKPSEFRSKKKRTFGVGTPSEDLTHRLLQACLERDDHPEEGEAIVDSSSQIEEFTQSGDLTNVQILTEKSEEEEEDESISNCSESGTRDCSSEFIRGSSGLFAPEDSDYDGSPQKRLCGRTGFANRVRMILEKHHSKREAEQRGKTEQKTPEKVKVMDKWSIGRSRYFLKCSHRDFEGKTRFRYIITDDGAVIWGAVVGSTLRIHPPWRTLVFGRPEVTVWTDVFRIEFDADEMESTCAREVFVAETLGDENRGGSVHLLYGTLLNGSISSFLC